MKTYSCLAAAAAAALSAGFVITGSSEQAAAQVAPPATAPATVPAARPATTAPAPITLDFRNAPLDAVLEHLSEAAGFVVVKDGAVDGRVTVVSRQPVSADEAVTLLNAVLRSNGYTAVRNGRMLRVGARDAAKKQNVPVHFGADPAAIDPTDELITQVVPIGNIDAVKLRADLGPLIGTEADVAANGGSNAIVITDTSANVRRVVQIVAALDRHEPGNAELRRYTLKHADAAAAVRLITTLLKPDGPANRPPEGKQPPEQAMRGRVTAVADDRTNTLFVSAQPATLTAVDGIVKDLEANPAAASEIKIFSLKFAEAGSAARLITGVFRPDDAQPRRDGEGRPQNPNDQALKARVVAQADDRTNTLVVTAPAATMKIVEGILTRLDADPSSTSEIRVFPLSFADAASAARLVQAVFRPADAQANPNEPPRRPGAGDAAVNARVTAAADDRTNSLVVTAPTETLKVIEKILQVLDANPAATAAVRSFPLKHADASSAVYLLNTLFAADAGRAAGVVPGPPPAPGLTPASTRGRLTAASDTRTNTVIVQAPAELMTAAEAVLRDLDSNPATEETLFIYRLRNGQAARMEQVLNVLFGNAQPGYPGASQLGRLGLGGGDAAGGRAAGQRLGAGSTRGRSTRGGTLGLGAEGPDARLAGLEARLGGRGLANGQNPQLSAGATRAVTELTGQVFVVADEDTNALLVTTGTKYLDQVKQVIAELDRPVPQVLIKVLVAEVTHDDGVDVGVDFSVLNRRANGEGQTIGTNFGLTGPAAPTGGLVVQLLESNVNATLRALATRGKLEVLSRPYILASDNQLASITVGNEVPFITNTRITDNGQQINTIEYQDVGIILNVTPHINPDGLVIMDVVPEISQLTSSTVAISEGVTAPVIAKRSAASRVGIRTGNTIVIGGLMEDRKTSTVSKVPLLGDVPLVGPLFSRTQLTKTKTELLIFLTPQVASQPDDLAPMTNDEAGGTQLLPDAVQPGMFERHMQGMRRGAVPLTRPTTAPATIAPPSGVDLPIRPTYRPTPATGPATRPATP